MKNSVFRRPETGQKFGARVERAAHGVNTVLFVFALGLAMLDLTCFCAFKAEDALPSAARVAAGPASAQPIATHADAAKAAKPVLTATGATTAGSVW